MICIWGVRKISSVDFLFSISGLWAELPFWVGPSRKHKAGIFSWRWANRRDKHVHGVRCLPPRALGVCVSVALWGTFLLLSCRSQSQTFSAPGRGGGGSKCAAQTKLVARDLEITVASSFDSSWEYYILYNLVQASCLNTSFYLLVRKCEGSWTFQLFSSLPVSSFPLSLFIIQNYVHFIILLLPS